ncbi:carnitine transporter, partial [Coemansia sp. RSA 2681]
ALKMSEVKTFTGEQIQQHATREDIWIVVHGKVYDVTLFLDEHPGGEEVILEHAGIDATEAFEDIGHSDDARDLLSKYFIGNLEVGYPAEKPKTTSGGTSGVKSFLSGGFGGMCLVAAGHPLDLLKVRMQTSTQYKSTMDCFRKTLAESGIRGMYRGMAAPLVGATPVFAICFWGYDQGQKIMRYAYNLSPTDKLSTNQTLFAGGFSAIPTTAVMAPMERIKCTLQVGAANSAGVAYKGPADAAMGIIRTGGFRSLFKGTCATLLRDVPGSVAYFGAYELIKKSLTNQSAGQGSISPLAI